jgi:hypothetical protein
MIEEFELACEELDAIELPPCTSWDEYVAVVSLTHEGAIKAWETRQRAAKKKEAEKVAKKDAPGQKSKLERDAEKLGLKVINYTPRPEKSNQELKAKWEADRATKGTIDAPHFKSMEEATKYAETKLGIKSVELGSNLRFAQRMMNGLVNAKAHGAALPPALAIDPTLFSGVAHSDTGAQINSHYGTAKPVTMEINPDASLWRVPGDRQWFASSDKNATLTHEIGHYNHLLALGGKAQFQALLGGARNRFTAIERDTARKVSFYAGTRPAEFVAETWAGRAAGKSYSSDVRDLYTALDGPTNWKR